MMSIHMLYATIMLTLRTRIRRLAATPEEGAGGHSLEVVLLAIGGVIAAGIVVAAIAAVVKSHTGDLNP